MPQDFRKKSIMILKNSAPRLIFLVNTKPLPEKNHFFSGGVVVCDIMPAFPKEAGLK